MPSWLQNTGRVGPFSGGGWVHLTPGVAMIAGDGDTLMGGSVAEYMKKAIGNARLKILPTGHLSAIEDPEKFNRTVLNFMQDLQWRE